jgi:hypothetical protein
MTTPFTMTPETTTTASYSFQSNNPVSFMPQTPTSLNTTGELMQSNSTPIITNNSEYSNNHNNISSNQYVKNLNFNESPLNTKVHSSSHVYTSINNNLDEINSLSYNNSYSNEHAWKTSQPTQQQQSSAASNAFYLY